MSGVSPAVPKNVTWLSVVQRKYFFQLHLSDIGLAEGSPKFGGLSASNLSEISRMSSLGYEGTSLDKRGIFDRDIF